MTRFRSFLNLHVLVIGLAVVPTGSALIVIVAVVTTQVAVKVSQESAEIYRTTTCSWPCPWGLRQRNKKE